MACLEEKRNICIEDFGGESDGKRQLGKTRLSWDENVKMDLK